MADKEQYSFRLVDKNGTIVRPVIEGISDCQLEWNVNKAVRTTGSLTMHVPMDWNLWQFYIQPVYHLNGEQRVLATLHARPESSEESRGAFTQHVALYDLTVHPHEDTSSTVWTEQKGAVVTSRIQTMLNAIGVKSSITPSSEKLRRQMQWEEITSKLTIMNEMLDAAGYFALHTNELGQFQAVPYKAPSKRGVKYVFRPDPAAQHTTWRAVEYPQVIPNKIVMEATGTGDAEGLRAMATDPVDFAATGIWRSEFSRVEATSQAVLDEHARRRLISAKDATGTVDRELRPVIPLAVNDVVSDETGRLYVVEKILLQLRHGELMKVTTREVKG